MAELSIGTCGLFESGDAAFESGGDFTTEGAEYAEKDGPRILPVDARPAFYFEPVTDTGWVRGNGVLSSLEVNGETARESKVGLGGVAVKFVEVSHEVVGLDGTKRKMVGDANVESAADRQRERPLYAGRVQT